MCGRGKYTLWKLFPLVSRSNAAPPSPKLLNSENARPLLPLQLHAGTMHLTLSRKNVAISPYFPWTYIRPPLKLYGGTLGSRLLIMRAYPKMNPNFCSADFHNRSFIYGIHAEGRRCGVGVLKYVICFQVPPFFNNIR